MKFSLITPQKEVATLTAASVTVPSESGEFGVLPGHVPTIATLQPGAAVRVQDEAGQTHSYTTTGGFADVRTDGVTILAEAVS